MVSGSGAHISEVHPASILGANLDSLDGYSMYLQNVGSTAYYHTL